MILAKMLAMSAVLAGWVATAAEAEIVRLSVDHLASPANIGARPSFGWQMLSERRGAAQTAYRIRLYERSVGGAEVWDSGEVADGRSVAVRYGGRPLRSAMRYAWTVAVKDERGEWLKPASASFDTGLFGDGDWTGSKWISAADSKVRTAVAKVHDRVSKQEAEDGTSCFVKTVPNGKAVKEAWLAVSGLGVFEAYVNGEPVSRKLADGSMRRDFLKPGFTHFAKTKHSFTYDVTHLVKTGAADANVVAAEVSAGWWRDKIVNFRGKKSALRAVLVLRHEDGSETRVGTDETWLSSVAGPVVRAAIFDGEDYDARVPRKWLSGSGLVGFKASEANGEFGGALVAMEGPGISLRRDLSIAPVEMYVWKGVDGAKDGEFGTVRKLRGYRDGDVVELDAGETLVVDFGQNAAAVPEFEFEAAAGTTLTMRPAEMLNDGNGAKKRGCDGPEGSAYFTNYRQARTTLNYTFAGGGVEKYYPQFSFFGYRYASITVTGGVKLLKIRSLPVSSIGRDMDTGRLSTGVADVNRLVKNVLWGQYSNYLSVPTDCPQRNERLGWTADTQVFALAGAYNADTYGFFVKWMRDMRDTQHKDGSYTGVAPEAQYGSERGEQLGWADAGVIVPYTMWRQFGDTSVVEQNWDSMKRYMALIDRTKFTSPVAMGHQWADWLSYEKLESCGGGAYDKGPDGGRIPKEDAKTYWQYLGGCYLTWDARMMAEMAKAAGFSGDAETFREMAERNLAYMRGKFLAEDGMLLPLFRDMQTPALFALKLGILEKPDAIAATKAALLQNFKDHGDCLQTGFLGTSILMDALTYDVGAPDMAYSLLLQHKNPSWLYSVDQGATTIWERWNSYTKKDGFGNAGMNSFNHYAYGAVLSWMYGSMAGIRAGEEGGYRRFVLAPRPDRRIGNVDAAFMSPYGEIKSAWRYDGGRWIWKFTVPANTTAVVTVPGYEPKEYPAGTYEVVRSL